MQKTSRRIFGQRLVLGAAGLAALASDAGTTNAQDVSSTQTGTPPVSGPSGRLNVLLIVADDLPTQLGCYGVPAVKTPNIDRLASRGVLFERAYCQTALCNPSRASFLSGLRPDTTGVHDLATPTRAHLKDWIFLPQYFRQSGYYSAKLGKVYHTGDTEHYGSLGSECEDPLSWDTDVREWGKYPWPEQIAASGSAKGYRAKWAWDKLRVSDEVTADGVVARFAVNLLASARPANLPFFLAAGFRRPHVPYSAPEKYFDLYPPDKVVLADEPDIASQHIPLAALTYNPSDKELSPQKRREGIAAKYAAISFFDAQVGLLLDALDHNRLWENTVVLLTTDHGYHLGEHGGMWHKVSNFEEAARVPFIIAAPGMKANVRCQRVVELVDVYPTLAELAGLPIPAGLHGASLVPLLQDPQKAWARPAFTQIQRPAKFLGRDDTKFTGRSIRTERWRYTEWDDGKKGTQLYDEVNDPKEYVNLAEEPARAPEAAGALEQLRTLLRATSNSWPKAEG